MDNEKKALLFRIGLGRRAGKVIFGTDAVCQEIKNGRVLLALVAEDVSDNTKKRITNRASYYNIKLQTLSGVTAQELGASIGRSAVACIAVTDENIVKLITGNGKE